MKTELKTNLSYRKTLLILSALCILSGLFSIVLGEIAVPFVTGFCAAIFVFETGRQKLFSFVVPVILIIINLLSVLLFGAVSLFWGILSIISAYIIFYAYKKSKSKFDFSLMLTGLVSVFTILSVLVVGMICVKEFSLEASLGFYGDLYSALRDDASKIIVDFYSEINGSTANGSITLSDAGEMIDAALGTLVSVVVVFGFIIAGFCFKVFAAIISRCADNREELRSWQFVPPSFYGHFYYVLILAYFFAAYNEGVFSTVIVNLYVIFMWIFAYVGFEVVRKKLFAGRRSVTVFIILALVILLFSSFVLQILAMLGALSVTRRNPETPVNP